MPADNQNTRGRWVIGEKMPSTNGVPEENRKNGERRGLVTIFEQKWGQKAMDAASKSPIPSTSTTSSTSTGFDGKDAIKTTAATRQEQQQQPQAIAFSKLIFL